jgi:hypothetical protein
MAQLMLDYLHSGDVSLLEQASHTGAADHLWQHAVAFSGWQGSKAELIASLAAEVSPSMSEAIERNISFVRDSVADSVEPVVLQYLPAGTQFAGSLYVTVGYDIGVAFGNNCNLNVAHPIFLADPRELLYYAVHELHHVGYIQCQGGKMPSLALATRADLAHLIAHLTHLEGTGTYAPYELRRQGNALGADRDYVILENRSLLRQSIAEYRQIAARFAVDPDQPLLAEDWQAIETMSSAKRLWYVTGAHLAKLIDEQLGRHRFTELLQGPPEQFVAEGFALFDAELVSSSLEFSRDNG